MKRSNLKFLIKNIVKESLDQKSKDHRDEFNCGRENVMGAVNIGEGWAMGGYTPEQQKSIDVLSKKGFKEVSTFPNNPDADNQGQDEQVIVVLEKRMKYGRLSVEVDPEGLCNGQPIEQFVKGGGVMENRFASMTPENPDAQTPEGQRKIFKNRDAWDEYERQHGKVKLPTVKDKNRSVLDKPDKITGLEEDEENTVGKHIDSGFYQITAQQAKQFSGGQLPRAGYEKLIPAPQGFKTQNGFVWLGITVSWNKQVWYIRDSKGWKLENGIARMPDNWIKKEESLKEMSSTGGSSGAGMGYQTPFSFSKNKNGSKRALDVTKRMGFKVAKSISETEK